MTLAKIIKENRFVLILLVILCFFVYANAIRGTFLSIDDRSAIVDNPRTQSFSQSFGTFNPYVISSFLVFKGFGMNSYAFHARGVVMHAINSILVFFVLYHLFKKEVASLASLIFAVHPANSEAVSWISGNIYTFYAFFSLLTLLLFVLYRKRGNQTYLLTSIGVYLLYVLSMRTAWVVVTPVLIVITDQLLLLKKNRTKEIRYYLPHILIAISFVAFWLANSYVKRIENLERLYYYNQEQALPYYLRVPITIYETGRILLFPWKLSFYNDGLYITTAFKVAAIVAAAMTVLVVFYLFRKQKVIGTMIILAFASILPAYSPFAIAVNSADRYFYLATVFFSGALVMGLRQVEKTNKIPNLTLFVCVLVITVFSIRTISRTNDWKDAKNLWLATEKTAPNNFKVYFNLGNAYFNEGEYLEAIKNYQKSLQLKPDYADAVHNIGYTYFSVQDYKTAEMYMIRSIQMNPNNGLFMYNLGVVEYNLGEKELAKEYIRAASQMMPNYSKAQEALQVLENEGIK